MGIHLPKEPACKKIYFTHFLIYAFMLRVFLLALAITLSTSVLAQKQITGTWQTEDKESRIAIYEDKGKFYGKILWLKHPNDAQGKPYTDTENPEPSLRTRPLAGLLLLKDFVYTDGKWDKGTIYNPNNGKLYTCTLWLSEPNELKVRGYWGIFYQTQTWIRINTNTSGL